MLRDVSRETLDRLEVYASLLLTWNRKINLISRADEAEIWNRHIIDALQLAAFALPKPTIYLTPTPTLPTGGREPVSFVDMGSGAGLPGLVLAIATGAHFHLIEADQRKAAFLREAARATAASVTIHACRIEAATPPPALLITARALAPLETLLSLSEHLRTPSTVCLFPKGQNAEREIETARATWTMRIERHISVTDRSGVILRISEVTRV